MPRELSLADIFQIGYYWETKILLTAVTLDLFSSLRGTSRTVAAVAQSQNLNPRVLELVMNALVAMRVLQKERDRYRNSPSAEKYLVKSSPEYVGHLLELHDSEWENWGKLNQAIRTGNSPVKQHVFETAPELGARVLTVLDRIGRGGGVAMAQRLGLRSGMRFLDIGGGAGTNAIAFCQECPGLNATVFDLPGTLRLTEQYVKEAGLSDRITLQPGNFLEEDFSGTYDVALMSDILHYQDSTGNAGIVKKAYHCLNPGGRLIIKDRFLDSSRTSPAWTTAFAVHIVVNTERGECFTIEEAQQWMEHAGFQAVEELEHCAMIQGTK